MIADPRPGPSATRTLALRAGAATRRVLLSARRLGAAAAEEVERLRTSPSSRARTRRALVRAASIAVVAALLIALPLMLGPRRTSASESAGGEFSRGAFLGELIGIKYVVQVHASARGPTYTVLDAVSRRELARDLLGDDVYRAFPDLDVRTLRAGESAGRPDPNDLLRPLMTAEPHRAEDP